MKQFTVALILLASLLPAIGQITPPTKVITATATPGGPIAVGQTVTVTVRLSSYDGPPADGFGVLVQYDPYVLSFVPGSFYLGTNAGVDQQWLTKPDQETVAEGYQPLSYCDGAAPGSVLVSLGDVGRGYPKRGTVASGGFLASFQLIANTPGTTAITPTNYAGIALYDLQHQGIPGAEFRGTSVLVRDTDIIPSVQIVSPSEGAIFQAPDKILLMATASVSYGSIARVEFYANEPKIGEVTNAPYSINWFSPTSGQYSLLAIARDNFGGVAASEAVNITVNTLPTVALTEPSDGASFTAPGTIGMSAPASDSDGSIAEVEFYADDTLIGTDTNAPYGLTWTNVSLGAYSLTARAVDNLGGATVSAPVNVTVRASGSPAEIVAAGSALNSEGGPANGGIDPGETVSVEFRLRNAGGSDTANLVATLQSSGGVVSPGGPQTYGVLTAERPSVGRSFTFTAYGSAGGTLTATLALQDGTNDLGTVSYGFILGSTVAAANTNAISIRDVDTADIYPSTITVSGLTGVVGQVTITLSNLSHTFPGDIDALLVGPAGQKVIFMSDAGGAASTNITLTFDDTASNSLPYSGVLSSGTYRPTDYETSDDFPSPAPAPPYAEMLSAFRGTDPNGVWSLYLVDDSEFDEGSLDGGWGLTISTFDPVDPVADLGVSIMDSPDPAGVGATVTYTVVVTNSGPEEARGVLVTNVLSPGLSFTDKSLG